MTTTARRPARQTLKKIIESGIAEMVAEAALLEGTPQADSLLRQIAIIKTIR